MSDFPEFDNSDDRIVNDPSSPFYGLPTGFPNTQPDPNEAVLDEVLDKLGIPDFGDTIISINDADPTGLRGNRFETVAEALIYLAEAGILSFGRATIDTSYEIGVEIDFDSGAVANVAR